MEKILESNAAKYVVIVFLAALVGYSVFSMLGFNSPKDITGSSIKDITGMAIPSPCFTCPYVGEKHCAGNTQFTCTKYSERRWFYTSTKLCEAATINCPSGKICSPGGCIDPPCPATGICIVSATYGLNTGRVFYNNARDLLVSSCSGKMSCIYPISIGDYAQDPVPNVPKNYNMSYKCGPTGTVKSIQIAEEAGWFGQYKLNLDCCTPITSCDQAANATLWSACSNQVQTRSCSDGCGGIKTETQACTQTCTSFIYSDWGACVGGTQTRTAISSLPVGCTGGSPILTQSCTIPCTSYTYSDWGDCLENGTQTRTVTSSSPSGCTGGNPVTTQSCTYVPPAPAQFCGNGLVEGTEICDRNAQSCPEGYTGVILPNGATGTMSCKSDCSGFDMTYCTPIVTQPSQVCKNNVIEGTEECDGTDLAGQTCVSKGFSSGTLTCDDNCYVDTTQCTQEPTMCSDTDGGDYPLTYGNVLMDKIRVTIYDTCADGTNVDERLCVSDTDYARNTLRRTCPNGCENGKCKPETASQPGITIISATYAGNIVPTLKDNALSDMSSVCNGKDSCDYTVDLTKYGDGTDPAQGYAKNFVAEYSCAGESFKRTLTIAPEANWQKRTIGCTCSNDPFIKVNAETATSLTGSVRIVIGNYPASPILGYILSGDTAKYGCFNFATAATSVELTAANGNPSTQNVEVWVDDQLKRICSVGPTGTDWWTMQTFTCPLSIPSGNHAVTMRFAKGPINPSTGWIFNFDSFKFIYTAGASPPEAVTCTETDTAADINTMGQTCTQGVCLNDLCVKDANGFDTGKIGEYYCSSSQSSFISYIELACPTDYICVDSTDDASLTSAKCQPYGYMTQS